jgi:uroporphyrinogen-III synthase
MDRYKEYCLKKRILYLGLSSKNFITEGSVTDYPVIEIKPFDLFDKVFDVMWSSFDLYTHLIFTSQTTVDLLLKVVNKDLLSNKKLLAVGSKTQKKLLDYGLESTASSIETAEGLLELIKDLHSPNVLYLHSKNSRPIIGNYLKDNYIAHFEGFIYETIIKQNIPEINLKDFDEVFFTSPSTVDAFKALFPYIPCHLKFSAIGPITFDHLHKVFDL